MAEKGPAVSIKSDHSALSAGGTAEYRSIDKRILDFI